MCIEPARFLGGHHLGRAQLSPLLLLPEVELDLTSDIAGNIYPAPGLICHQGSDIFDPLGKHVIGSGYAGRPATAVDGPGISARSISAQHPAPRDFIFSEFEARVRNHASGPDITGGEKDQQCGHDEQSCRHYLHASTCVPPHLAAVQPFDD